MNRAVILTVAVAAMLFSAGAAALAAEREFNGVNVTVYYTPVESYHPLSCTRTVKAWPNVLTVGSKVTAGPYPCRFVTRVKEEGTGRITSGKYAGMYLNFSWEGLGKYGDQQGFWLDTAPRDSYGNVLVPFVTAAADSAMLPRGTLFKVLNCGRQDDGSGPDAKVCEQFKAGDWHVQDEFTTGLGGENHVDLYIGEEDQPEFERRSPKYVDLTDVVLRAY